MTTSRPSGSPAPLAGLNENHRRHLVSSAEHATKLIRQCEQMLAGEGLRQVPPAHHGQTATHERIALMEGLARLQAQLHAALGQVGLALSAPRHDVRYAVRVMLRALDITFEEMAGRHMRGYGTMAPEAERLLDELAGSLQESVRALDRLVADVDGQIGDSATPDAALPPGGLDGGQS